jgi:fructokinase
LVDLTEQPFSRPSTYVAHPGGSPFNVAVGLARLGQPVEFAGSFAEDALGSRLRDFLEGEGVGLTCSTTCQAQTALAVTSLVNAEPQYSFYAAPASYGFLEPKHLREETVRAARAVHAGSISLLQPSTMRTALAAFDLVDGLRTLDPNVRPGLVDDWSRYRRDLEELSSRCDLIKLSVEDAEALLPGEEAERCIEWLLELGVGAVVLTEGAGGAQVHTPAGHVSVPIARVGRVVNTTGAGDSTMASIIAQLLTDGTPAGLAGWRTVTETAMVAAALTCSRPGGAESLPNAEEFSAAVQATASSGPAST